MRLLDYLSSTVGRRKRQPQQTDVIETLAQQFLDADSGPDKELARELRDDLGEAMIDADERTHSTAFKGQKVQLSAHERMCGIRPGKDKKANEWLAAEGLSLERPETIERFLAGKGRLNPDLFFVGFEVEVKRP